MMDGKVANLLVQFIDQNSREERQEFAQTTILVDSKEWKKYEVVMKSPRTIAKANLRIFLTDDRHRSGGDATVDLEHILFENLQEPKIVCDPNTKINIKK